MTAGLELDDVITADEVALTADHLEALQLDNGMIPWFPGGHCDPWNHVESAMALDVAGRPAAAALAYRWLADTQRPDGSWHNYYRSDGSVEEAKLDTNVCAYIATGVLHHLRCTGDLATARALWSTVTDALDFVLAQRRSDGLPLWAVEVDDRPWDYALLTGTASIQHSLRCGAELGRRLGAPRPDWDAAADVMIDAICDRPDAFEPKTRWAMDWYYPVLTGALPHAAAVRRMADGQDAFTMDGFGIRCVSDEPWVTASETAECALAYAAIGDIDTATDLLRWTRSHRCPDGAYWTGIVYPDRVEFPFEERTSYTAAALLLAVDAITETTAASDLFSLEPPVARAAS